ncbi:hypothetical protein BDF22DRAFT_678590 [Syncephalis plumigaleata]|nr:hypothetical protein BDF22DRAFT_678590 [Syncephalis plumigaleata]
MRVFGILTVLALIVVVSWALETTKLPSANDNDVNESNSAKPVIIRKLPPMDNLAVNHANTDGSDTSTAATTTTSSITLNDIITIFDNPAFENEIVERLRQHISDKLVVPWNDFVKPLTDRIYNAFNTDIRQSLEANHPEIVQVLRMLTEDDKKALANTAATSLVVYASTAQTAFNEAVHLILTREISRFVVTLIQEIRSGKTFDQALRTAKRSFIAAVKEALIVALNIAEATFDKLAPDNFFLSLNKAIKKYLPSLAASFGLIQKAIQPAFTKLIIALIKNVFDLLRSRVDTILLESNIDDILSNTINANRKITG